MKTSINFKMLVLTLITMLFISCSSGRHSNTGKASDRTGTNGATNGTGKVP